MARGNLGEAAGAALDQFGGDGQQEPQEALVPACRVKFAGMAWDSLEEVPQLKDRMRFEVVGVVTAHTVQVMKDGELREVAVVTVDKVVKIDLGQA